MLEIRRRADARILSGADVYYIKTIYNSDSLRKCAYDGGTGHNKTALAAVINKLPGRYLVRCGIRTIIDIIDGRLAVNLYFWLILFAYVLILARGVIRGFEKGFVKEIEGLVAGICSIIVLVLTSGLVTGTLGENVSTKAMAIAMLIVLGILYFLCRIIFSSLKLFAGLPVIKIVDQILGAGAGGIKAFMLLYVVDHILKIWLNL